MFVEVLCFCGSLAELPRYDMNIFVAKRQNWFFVFVATLLRVKKTPIWPETRIFGVFISLGVYVFAFECQTNWVVFVRRFEFGVNYSELSSCFIQRSI